MAKCGYYLTRGLMRALGALPLGFHLACGKALGWLAGSVFRYRRDVVDINLARSFPDRKYGELARIRKDFYRHLGTVFAEAVWFCGCEGARGGERLRKEGIVRMTNPEVLNALYDGSDSVVLLAAHTGNWELFQLREHPWATWSTGSKEREPGAEGGCPSRARSRSSEAPCVRWSWWLRQ